ncbi:MAG: CHAT domain-containing protein [Arthrospira sp. SH-MAG29]|nr:CHAT domain-containing protein [Arthrospira sp. SH-MAG29]MBS0017515.1 CHAT domain-containing protein [Arthrospira sp. SH-MAG29]
MKRNYITRKIKLWKPLTRWLSLAIAIALSVVAVSIIFTPIDTNATSLSEDILGMDHRFQAVFEDHFGRELPGTSDPPEVMAQTLSLLAEKTGTKPAILWVSPRIDHLHLVLINPGGEPVVEDLYEVPQELLNQTAREFRQNITRLRPPLQLGASQQLYEWIIKPLEPQLQADNIDTLLFCAGEGLRGIPFGALYDGQQFLVEKYSLSHIPAFNLIDRDYKPIQPDRILAMGASEFQTLEPLPAVPVELSAITYKIPNLLIPQSAIEGQFLLNQDFTTENLLAKLANQDFDIIHWATHAEFNPGNPDNSYIQFWDSQLTLRQLSQIPWNSPPELLVLSACQTALGNEEAELGFAGLALQAGVKSAVASLWNISDLGTLALMSEFYLQLAKNPTKAEALQQAQINLLRGDVSFDGDRLLLSEGVVLLPEGLNDLGGSGLRHPFYWGGFTMISSPW